MIIKNRLNMKHSLSIILALAAAGHASAQTEAIDSIDDATELHEIVIEAPKVIRKADMDVYSPSRSAVENSKNGVQLLNKLMIPSLNVNDVLGSITAAGRPVQLRINGRTATIDQVRGLLPETIKRVEWIDNPGLRYQGAEYVINFVVANPTLGGSLMARAQPVLNQEYGNYFADAKLNVGRSQWNVWTNFKLTEHLSSHRDYTETFTYPDGQTLTRTETPKDGHLNDTRGVAYLTYNYIKPDTTVFYVSLGAYKAFSQDALYNSILSQSDRPGDIDLLNSSGSRGTTPSFSAYLEQHFAHKQTLVVDFGASLYYGHSYSDYIEREPGNQQPITDVHTYINDRNQAYALEADYIKNWGNSRLTAGISYKANRNRSAYQNLGGEIFHQRQDKVYFFAEYFQRLNKFTITAGLGAQYTSFLFRETDHGQDSWNLRPQATLTYALNNNHRLRLSFTTWQATPSLAETNIVAQHSTAFSGAWAIPISRPRHLTCSR